MAWWEAIILGLVEGLTEYLPVSSTGHLLLVQELLGIGADNKTAADAYAIVIQLGAILAVLGIYFPYVKRMAFGLIGRDRGGLELLGKLFLAFMPAAIIALSFQDVIKQVLFGLKYVIFAWYVGGVAILVWEKHWRRKVAKDARPEGLEHVSWGQALGIGLFQCLAVWPGTSRSLATILGGCVLKVPLRTSVEFSFLLGALTLGAATCYDGLKHGGEMIEDYGLASLLLGLLVALVSAVFAVKWMVGYLNRNGLAVFGWYRIALALVAAFWLL